MVREGVDLLVGLAQEYRVLSEQGGPVDQMEHNAELAAKLISNLPEPLKSLIVVELARQLEWSMARKGSHN
jgi:hypothetical protein